MLRSAAALNRRWDSASELGIPWASPWAVDGQVVGRSPSLPADRPAGLSDGEAEHAHVRGFVQFEGQRQPGCICRASDWKSCGMIRSTC